MVEGENFGKYGTIHQSFTHPNLYHKTAGINSATNEYQANSGEHAWLNLVTTKSTWTLFNPCYSPQSMPVALALPGLGSLSQRSYAPS